MKDPVIISIVQNIPFSSFCGDELNCILKHFKGAWLVLPTDMPDANFHDERLNEVEVDLCLARTKKQKILNALLPVGNLFRAAVSRECPFAPFAWLRHAHALASKSFFYKKLDGLIASRGWADTPLVVYTYWFTPATYAAYELKRKYPHLMVVSRAHGIDLFPERHKYNYMPLRKTCGNQVDILCPCSRTGAQKLIESGIRPEKIRLSYLGVPEALALASPPPEGKVVLVSCSSADPVKRLGLMIESILAFALAEPRTEIEWHHFGGGNFFSQFANTVSNRLSGLSNVRYFLHGHVSVETIREFYIANKIYAFVSTSLYEGLPVSMMEAISAGIPILGTNVGGVAELVTGRTGELLPASFVPDDFIAALKRLSRFRSGREQIVEFFLDNFWASVNYSKFYTDVLLYSINLSEQKLNGSD